MNRQTVIAARDEALLFVTRCDNLLAVKVTEYDPTTSTRIAGEWRATYNGAPKQMGALRRSSMDLTRALAEMRKP